MAIWPKAAAVVFTCAAVSMPQHAYAQFEHIEENNIVVFSSDIASSSLHEEPVTITVSRNAAAVEDIITLQAVFQEAPSVVKKVYGWLRSPKEFEYSLAQERFIQFTYDQSSDVWTADYTVTPYDHPGMWTFDFEYMDEESQFHPISNISVFSIENTAQLEDTELPQLTGISVQSEGSEWSHENIVSHNSEMTIRVQASDNGSGLQSVTLCFTQENGPEEDESAGDGSEEADASSVVLNEVSLSEQQSSVRLQYSETDEEWTGTYIPEAAMTGRYAVSVRLTDYFGNVVIHETNYVMIVEETEQPEPPVPPEEPAPSEQEGEGLIVLPGDEPVAPVPQYEPEPEVEVDKQEAQQERTENENGRPAPPEVNKESEPVRKQASPVWYAVGTLLLAAVLRSNREWTE